MNEPSRLSLFIYGQLDRDIHIWLNSLGLFSVLVWLYFALIEKAFISRFIHGDLMLLDILIGLPLVIALAPVVYAVIYWSGKWLVILFWPGRIRLPDHDGND